MNKIDVLRHQHQSALELAQRLLDLIDVHQPGGSGYSILMQLNRLYGLLRVHFAQEDAEIYSVLRSSGDSSVARTAIVYAEQMGGLAVQVEDFARRWCCSAGIIGSFEEFRTDAQNLVMALAVRVDMENRHIYPLAEETGEAPAERAAA